MGTAGPIMCLYNPSTRGTVLWYMDDNVRIGSAFGPTLPAWLDRSRTLRSLRRRAAAGWIVAPILVEAVIAHASVR